jgi:hypothetical protein
VAALHVVGVDFERWLTAIWQIAGVAAKAIEPIAPNAAGLKEKGIPPAFRTGAGRLRNCFHGSYLAAKIVTVR